MRRHSTRPAYAALLARNAHNRRATACLPAISARVVEDLVDLWTFSLVGGVVGGFLVWLAAL